jgi:O-antigen chain-terminating methyltransferase
MHIVDLQNSLRLLFDETRKRLSEPMNADQVKNILAEEDHLLDALYVVFEDRFRGSREDIKERVKVYLPYIKQTTTRTDDDIILDIGCGRGEWLELLRDNGYKARGIDLNRVMAQQCRERGLDVTEADAVRYLTEQKSNTFSAITGLHIAEHPPFKTLIRLLDESLRTLRPGGVVIFETPNPENLIVGACNFYFDPTHRNPIPPELLKFIIEQRGFAKIDVLRLHPNDFFQDTSDAEHVRNELKVLFTKELDYSVIAFKPA